jgi:hypothetical protein
MRIGTTSNKQAQGVKTEAAKSKIAGQAPRKKARKSITHFLPAHHNITHHRTTTHHHTTTHHRTTTHITELVHMESTPPHALGSEPSTPILLSPAKTRTSSVSSLSFSSDTPDGPSQQQNEMQRLATSIHPAFLSGSFQRSTREGGELFDSTSIRPILAVRSTKYRQTSTSSVGEVLHVCVPVVLMIVVIVVDFAANQSLLQSFVFAQIGFIILCLWNRQLYDALNNCSYSLSLSLSLATDSTSQLTYVGCNTHGGCLG